MEEIISQRATRRRWRRIWYIMATLAAFYTTYVLILPAITMSRQLICGKKEHVHQDACFGDGSAAICGMEEHTHSEFCYDVGPADADADVEATEDWERSVSGAKLLGQAAEDVTAVALTQLGYQESSRNYEAADALTINGYTRYGAWYGNPYGDWDAMFASFVLHYAGVDELGRGDDPQLWAETIAREQPQRYKAADAYQPNLGDLVFFDRDLDGAIDRVGILIDASEDTWRVMEGNAEDAVSVLNYAPGDERIAAYGLVTEPEAPEQVPNATASTEEITPPIEVEAEPTANEAAPTSDSKTIALKKQIERLGTNPDEYNYRLHLTLDGSTLSAGSTTTVTPTKQRHIGILLDVTETMTATSDWGSNGENKFDAVRSLLQGNDGFLNAILDGNTYVSVIVVGGQSGYGTYETLSKQIAAGDKPGDFSNINNDLHLAQGISYVTGLMAAEKYLGNDIDSLVFIVGNNPDTHIKYSDGTLERGTSGNNAANKDYADYQTFMGNHPGLSMYMVGVAPVNRGSTTAQKMGKYSQDRGTGGGYFEANSKDELKEHLTQISQTITVKPDKVEKITITDPLSANVTLAAPYELKAELKMLNSDGSVKTTTDVSDKVTVGSDVITCNYPDAIEGPFKLEIAFNIQTADGKYQPYTDTSDANTVWGEENSAAQQGYYSNGDAKASYTLNGTTSTDVPFPHPVVQAPQKATITLKKEWANAADADKKPVTVTLHRGSVEGETAGEVTLSAENGWTASCDVKILTAGSNQIFAVEQAIDGFTTTYSTQSVAVAANGTHPITVTNTKQGQAAKLTVNKHWQNVPGTQNATIHVAVKDGTGYKDIEGSPFTVTGDGSREFTIQWTEATPPELTIYEERGGAFYPVMSGDGQARNVAIADQQYSAMVLTPEANGEYTVTLTNLPVVQMPETGGPGVQWYVFSGFALIIGAALLMRKKGEGRAGQPPFGE